MKTQMQINKEVEQDAKKGLVMQFTGMLSALIPVLAILGISLDWFTDDFVNNLYIFLMALVPFVVNLYTIYKNHFSGREAKEQNRVLKEEELR